MPKPDYWTPEMYERLRELYPTNSNEVLEKITGWCKKEMQYRAGRIGIKKDKSLHKKTLQKLSYIPDLDKFIADNFNKHTNKEMAALSGFNITTIRTRCYAMGLLRMTMEYWTDEQVLFLKENYQSVGDKEFADIYNGRWPKQKTWTIKHIEKKRKYLGLKRNKEELYNIYTRNLANGRWIKNDFNHRWDQANLAKIGDVRLWKASNGGFLPVIKAGTKWEHWAPHTWKLHYGPVPANHVVTFKDGCTDLVPESLEVITRSEMTKRACLKGTIGLSDNYVASTIAPRDRALQIVIRDNKDLLELKRQQILLKRLIKQQNGDT